MILNKCMTRLSLALVLGLSFFAASFAQAANQAPTVNMVESVVTWGPSAASMPANLTGVTALATGRTFTLALKNDGTVIAWGTNANNAATVPAALADPATANVIAIAIGWNHSLALKNDGTVVQWGDLVGGVVVVPTTLTDPATANVIAIAAGNGSSLALKADGTVVGWGSNGIHGAEVASVPAGLATVTAIAVGDRHAIALKSDGTVVGWGAVGLSPYGGGGENVTFASNVVAIAAGTTQSFVLHSDGTVQAFGLYTSSGSLLSGVTSISASSGASSSVMAALKSDGTLTFVGTSASTQNAAIPANLGIVEVIAAGDTPVVLRRASSYQLLKTDLTSRTIELSNITAGLRETAQTSTVLFTSSNHSVALDPTPTTTTSFSTVDGLSIYHKSYTYALVGNIGITTMTATVLDSLGSQTVKTFTVDATSVNSVPSFTKGADITTTEIAQPYTQFSWATDISVGTNPDDTTAGQVVDFIVTNNNNSVFTTQPAISSNGTLTFTPKHNISTPTVVTVTVSIHDNGGTLYSGVDTSATQTFTITLNPNVPTFNIPAQNLSLYADPVPYLDGAGFVDTIVPGAVDAGQTQNQTFTVTLGAGFSTYFSVQPAISSSGVLTFTPSGSNNRDIVVTGSVVLSVTSTLAGSTADLSTNNSGATHTFSITLKSSLVPVGPLASGGKIDSSGLSADRVLTSDGLGGSIWKHVADIAIDGDLEGGLTGTNQLHIKDGVITAAMLASGVAISGPTGATGAAGATGPAGTNGTNGVDGAVGPQGTAGAAGVAGATGPAGTDGTNGTNGVDGAVGAQGPAGPTGATGATGIKGDAGATGVTGAKGADGAAADFPKGTLITLLSTTAAPAGWTAVGTETKKLKDPVTKKNVTRTVVTYSKN